MQLRAFVKIDERSLCPECLLGGGRVGVSNMVFIVIFVVCCTRDLFSQLGIQSIQSIFAKKKMNRFTQNGSVELIGIQV